LQTIAKTPQSLNSPKNICPEGTLASGVEKDACYDEQKKVVVIPSKNSPILSNCIKKSICIKTIPKRVIYNNLEFEQEYYEIPKSTYETLRGKGTCPSSTVPDKTYTDFCLYKNNQKEEILYGKFESIIVESCLKDSKPFCLQNAIPKKYFTQVARTLSNNLNPKGTNPLNFLNKSKNSNDLRAFGRSRSRINKPKYIIIHHTAITKNRDNLAIQVINEDLSVNYLISSKGKLYYILDESLHPEGTKPYATIFDKNGEIDPQIIDESSIQVEINYDPWKSKEAPNTSQIKALSKLVADLVTKYNLPPESIFGHSSVQPCGIPNQGDTCRHNEPSFLMFNSTVENNVRIHPNLYIFSQQLLDLGLFEEYAFSNGKHLGLVIAQNNLRNAILTLQNYKAKSNSITPYQTELNRINSELKKFK
jgi:hypothetical protein